MKVRELKYSKNWNTDDFIGKYHLNRIDKEQKTPIPGTQIRRDQEHLRSTESDRKAFQDSLEESEKLWKEKASIKHQLAAIRDRVYVKAIIGEPLKKVEKILDEKVVYNNPDPILHCEDSQEDIKKFIKNVTMGRDMYVPFAIVTAKFKSINYQDPQTGNTALHIAVRKGYVKVVRQLLDFKADPDLKNRLGNTAAHEAWLFWRNPQGFEGKHRTREERLDEEERTCLILSYIFKFNGSINNVDGRGQSVLHIACR
jgi:hypothetical protein